MGQEDFENQAKNPEIPPEPEEEIKPEKRERVEVEKEISKPWEKMEFEEEEKLSTKYAKGFELAPDAKKFIGDIFQSEAEEKRIEFAKEWFGEHKDDLKEEGIAADISDEKKAAVAIEKGALTELKTKREYKEKYEAIENINALRTDFSKDRVPIESQFLALNTLEKKAEKLKHEKSQMEAGKRPALEIQAKEKELTQLFNARKELAEKISGRDLGKEAAEEAATKIASKDDYVDANREEKERELFDGKKTELFELEWDKLSSGERAHYNNGLLEFAVVKLIQMEKDQEKKFSLDEGDIFALREKGYKAEDFRETRSIRDWFQKRIQLKEGEKITPNEFRDFVAKTKKEFVESVENKAKESLAKEWESKYQELYNDAIKLRICKLAKSPEKAFDGVEGMYKKIRERLIAECAEKDLKKEPKTKEQLKDIEKEFKKKGISALEFIKAALTREDLDDLTGDFEEDTGTLLNFLGKHGMKGKKFSPEQLAQVPKVKKEEYREQAGKEMGFLDFLLGLIFWLLAPAEKTPKGAPKGTPSKGK